MDQLESAIRGAHRSGDQERLKRLQAQYRSEVGRGLRSVIRYGPSPTLTLPGQPRPTAARENTPENVTQVNPARGRSTSAPGIVALTPHAQRSISGYYLGDQGRETGGFMWGGWPIGRSSSTLRSRRARAWTAAPPGLPTTWNISSSTTRSWRPIIGDWHTHPGQAEPETSAVDRKTWTRHAGEAGIPWASIIVGDVGSPYNPMRAFITEFRGGNSRTYPAALVEED